MFLNVLIFTIFSSFCLLSSIFVIFSKNPIFSVLFLIFTFICVTCLLFTLNLEFLPISFIVVYVGAIAVLLLFVIMMLNIKLSELSADSKSLLPFALIFGCFLFFEVIFLFQNEFANLKLFNFGNNFFLADSLNSVNNNTTFLNFLSLFSNVKTIAFTLFSDYLFCFFLSSLILLLAMVGTIVLTLKKRWKNKTQNIYLQLMKNTQTSLTNYV